MKENPFNQILKNVKKNAKRTVLAVGLATSPLAGISQSDSLQLESSIPKESNFTERKNLWANESYQTLDGNFRYYHNPTGQASGEGLAKFSLGSTKSPFTSQEEMKEKTRVPESITETDFFTNYVNAGNETKTYPSDKVTGNRYANFSEYDPTIDSVEYGGDKHWNIQRFLIDPHYSFFNIKKDEARNNALYDLYKYFLYQEKGNRDIAWEKANDFLVKNVDPIVESKYDKWVTDNGSFIWKGYNPDSLYYDGNSNLYKSDNTTSFPKWILTYNSGVLSGAVTGKLFGRQEIIDLLTDYNITYRKKSPAEAKNIAENSVREAYESYRKQEEELRNRPVTEYKVIKPAQLPKDFYNWPIDEQQAWEMGNEDKLGEYQQAFSEKDRKEQLKQLSYYRFAD